jgi:peroxiredoxin
LELEALQEVFSEVESLGATLVAISPQLQKYQKQTANKFGLSFRLLCDEGNKVASRFGVAWTMPKNMQEIYRAFDIDLERFNGDDSWQLPIPGRFIIDRKGII